MINMKKIIITLLISLVIAAGVTGFKNVYSCKLPCEGRGIQSCIEAGDLDVLFLGSSTFRCNIDMKEMDAFCDGKAYDVCYAGNQPVAMQLEYPELKNGGSSAKLIVLDMNPMILYQPVKISDTRVIWDLSWKSKLKLCEKMKESGETDLSTFYEFFVTAGMDDLVTYPLTNRFYGTRYYKGAKTDNTEGTEREVLYSEKYDLSKEKVNDTQTDSIKNLIEECRNDGQEIVFLETPHYERLENDPAYIAFLDTFRELLDEEDTHYILASDIDFDNTDAYFYEDLTHMSATGRKAYTDALLKSGYLNPGDND